MELALVRRKILMCTRAKRIMAILLCAISMLQATACSNTQKKNDDEKNAVQTIKLSSADVWSAPSTVKIEQDDIDYANKGLPELHYNAVRNEYESHQLIITAKEEVTSYDIEICDLFNGENKIDKKNIEVYNERYIYAERPTASYKTTYMPDALIPLDAAREYGDLTIEKDKNAAFWITIYVPKDIRAGIYEGGFKLTVNGESTNIPVQVKVNDYTLTDEVTARTLFTWRTYCMAAGELDSTVEEVSSYYEFFLNYRVSPHILPMESLNAEEVSACIKKYYDKLSSYALTAKIGDVSYNLVNQEEDLRMQLYTIAEMSSPEKNYLDKAMIYLIDEPDIYNEVMMQKYKLDNYEKMNQMLVKIADEIESDTTGRFDSFKKIENWRKYIVDIPNIVPTALNWALENLDTERVQSFFDLINCFCPYWSSVQQYSVEFIEEVSEKYDLDMWWYGCTAPIEPSATYHVYDSNLLSSRSITWLQKKYNILGNLYWGCAVYSSDAPEYFKQYNDIWNGVPVKYAWPLGDGNLSYPGAAYGLDEPIPSIRLMSIRDGNEEYELLSDIENKYNLMSEANGNAFNVEDVMEPFYSSLGEGDVMYKDGQYGLEFDTLRASLIETAVLLQKGIDFALEVENIDDNLASIVYYASENCKVSIDGKEQKPVSGNRYEYQLNLNDAATLSFVFETAEGSCQLEKFIGSPTYILQELSKQADLSCITMPENSTAKLVQTKEYSTDGSSVLLNVNGVITGDTMQDTMRVQSIELDITKFEGIDNLSEASLIGIDIYNPGEEFTFDISIHSGSDYVPMGSFVIENGKNTITLDIESANFAMIEQADVISFDFVNSDDGKTAKTYSFYMDKIVKID